MDDHRDFKIKAPEFDVNLNLEDYLDSVQSMERITEFQEYWPFTK